MHILKKKWKVSKRLPNDLFFHNIFKSYSNKNSTKLFDNKHALRTELKRLLGDPEVFNNLKASQKKQLNDLIKNASNITGELGKTINSPVFSANLLKKAFEEDLKMFSNLFTKRFNDKLILTKKCKINKRKLRKKLKGLFVEALSVIYHEIINQYDFYQAKCFKTKNDELLYFLDLTDKKIESQHLFIFLLMDSIRIAELSDDVESSNESSDDDSSSENDYDSDVYFEESIRSDFDPLQSSQLKVQKSILINNTNKYIIAYLWGIVADSLSKDEQFNLNVLKDLKKLNYNWTQDIKSIEIINRLTITIVNLFSEIPNFSINKTTTVSLDSKKVKDKVWLILPIYYTVNTQLSLLLPDFCKPEIIKKQDNDLVRPIFNGLVNVQFSDNVIELVNNKNKTKFVIDNDFVNAFTTFFNLSYTAWKKTNCQIPNNAVLNHNLNLIKKMRDQILINYDKIKLYYLIRNVEYSLAKKNLPNKKKGISDETKQLIENKALSSSNLLVGDLMLFKTLYQLKKKIVVLKNQINLIKSNIDFAFAISGYIFYFKNNFDYRLRFYPVSYMFSVVTGYFKFFTKQKDPFVLKNEGLLNMLSNYYFYTVKKIKFEDFLLKHDNLLSKKSNVFFEEFLLFYSKNKIELNSRKNYMYYLKLELSLNTLVSSKSKLTHFLIEIDQTASGAFFSALLLKNKKIAQFTNLIPSKYSKLDFYENLNVNCIDFIKKNKPEYENLILLLKNERKYIKSLSMCWFYGQTLFGRKKKLKEIYLNSTNTVLIPDNVNKELIFLATSFTKFINEVFPLANIQLELLKKIFSTYLKEAKTSKIQTIDKCLIDWRIFEKTESTSKFFCPLQERWISFRFNSTTTENSINEKKHGNGYIPNVIHSMDASFLRLVSINYFTKTNENLVTLHDSFSVNPNNLKLLLSLLEKNIIDSKLNKPHVARLLIFEPLLSNSNEDLQKQLKKHITLFEKNENKFKITKSNFDINKHFTFEK